MADKKRYGFVMDLSRCIDCRACLVSCSVENSVPMNHTRNWVKDLGVKGQFPNLQRTFVPYNCMHCTNPPCTQVCVSGATYKDQNTGLVLVDQEACIGCGYCVEACPYGARYLDEKRGVVDKCTGCIQRVEIGQEPACVATCLGGARLFGDFNDPNSTVSVALQNARSVQTLDYEKGSVDTEPGVYYINGSVSNAGVIDAIVQPHDPHYTVSEDAWKKLLTPLLGLGIGGAFLVQATYFVKQLLEGEKEFEE